MSTNPNSASNNCNYCNFALPLQARFCPNCGKSISQRSQAKLNTKQVSIIVILTIATSLATYFLQPWFQGKRPTSQRVSEQHFAKSETDTAESNSNLSLEELFAKAEGSMQKIAESKAPEPALVLEAVDTLSRILSVEPENSWSLLQMAELAFEQRIFDKSAEFYERYLKIEKDDLAVRTRYASALTFNGKAEQALKELDSVLKVEPDNFQALAFSAIASHEMGQKEKSQAMLSKALELAPSEEAKDRLQKFALSLDKDTNPAADSNLTSSQTTQTQAATPAGLSPQRGNISKAFALLDSYYRNHPIAGPKYVGLEVRGSEIRASFDNFPMDKMPPMVKEKFSNNSIAEIKKESAGQKYTLVFVDKGTGAEMLRVEVQ